MSHPACPVRKGVVRVTQYEQRLVVRPGSTPDECSVYLHYFDNPGGALPAWLVKWAASTGAPKYLQQMETAAREYPAFAAAKGAVSPK